MFADVDGARLYYERTGSGPALLFVHGATLDHRMWRPQVEALASRHSVITYDVRGCGRSSVPDGPFCHYEDASALLDHLRLARAVVIGHSIGGLYALELALARPDRIAACALVCMSGLGNVPFPADVQAMFGAIRTAAREHGVAAAKAIWSEAGWFAPAREHPALAAELDLMLADYSGWYWTHDNPSQNLVPPVLERLEQLAIPALVVEGGRDLPYNHAIADELSRRIPDATRVRLPGAGHMANLEDATTVTRAIAELAQRVAL